MSKKIEFLTFEEELELIKAYQTNECNKSLSKLIESNYPLICSFARKKSNYLSIQYDDLVQEGTIGFITSVKRYDLNSGNRLNTYARFYIEHSMYEYIMKNSTLIKFSESKTNKKIFFNIGKYRNSDGVLTSSSVKRMAEDLGVPEKEILEMHSHLTASYFDCSETDKSEEYSLSDSYYEPNEFLRRMEESYLYSELLNSGLDKFNDRMSDIIRRRYLSDDPETLSEIAKRHNISNERVRQIEADAIKKLRNEFLGLRNYS